MAEPLILWNETLRFLELLGRSPDSVDALLFPPKTGPGSDKGAKKIRLDAEGRQSVERLLSMPLYRFHSLGIRPNPGGNKAAEITEGRAIWFEADGGLPIEAQEALPELLGLPEPTVSVWSGNRSLHHYWVAEEGKGLRVEDWKRAQTELIYAVKFKAPDAGVDEGIKDPPRAMRAPGGVHPATGERCRIHASSGKRYSLMDLWLILSPPPEATLIRREKTDEESLQGFEGMLKYMGKKLEPCDRPSSILGWKKDRGEEFISEWRRLIREYCTAETAEKILETDKAITALSFLPPNEFSSYGKWLNVGMALHSLIPKGEERSDLADFLMGKWRAWSWEMDGYYPPYKDAPGVAQKNGEELNDKWQSFSSERDSSITLGSLIHWAKEHGYRSSDSADTSSRYTAGLSSLSSLSSPTSDPVRGRRRLSTQERLDLLRETAGELLSEGATPLDRLPVLRERASELDLSMRDGELQKIVWEARRKNAPPAEALKPGDLLDFTPVPWCWEGLIMRKATSLVIASPKVGKTSLVLEAIASWNRGESFLGRAFHGPCPPVLIVGSDQPQSDWGRMLQKVGLVSEERRLLAPIVGLFHSGAPLSLDPEGIEKITTYAKDHPDLLVVIDSYSRCVASLGVSERDAEIAGPLADLQEALGPYGATIVVIHHSNKGSHESGSMASRGSTALPAACSQILHLQRLEPSEGGQQGSLSGKRMLSTEGRGGAPEKLLLELDPEGRWLFKGDGDALRQEQERQKIVGSLNDRQAVALEHVEEVWDQTEGRQGVSADLLASLMELRGSDTSRVARRLLEQLRERGLVRKVIENHGMGRALVARYIPFDATPTSKDSADSKDSPAVKREEVSLPAEPLSEESGDAMDLPPVSLFESVEVFQGGEWRNGWVVSEEGEELELFRSDNPEETLRLDWSLVRPCRS